MIAVLKKQENLIANEELGGDYAPHADAVLYAAAQKKAHDNTIDPTLTGGMPEISGTVNIWDRSIHLDNGTRTDETGKKLQWPNWQPESASGEALSQRKWNYQTGANFDAFSGTWQNPDGSVRTQNDKVITDKNQLEMMKIPKNFYNPPVGAKLTQTSYPGVRVPWDEPAQKPWTYQTGASFDSYSGTWINPDGTKRRQDDTVVSDPY